MSVTTEFRGMSIASIYCSDAARYFASAMAVEGRKGAANVWCEYAMNSLRSAVAALGYQIVPITTPPPISRLKRKIGGGVVLRQMEDADS